MRINELREWIRKIASFLMSNALGTVVDTAVLWCFSHHVFDSYVGENIISPCISFECAVLCNFCCAFYFVWRNRVNDKNLKTFVQHFWKYNLSCVGGFTIKMILLLSIERITHFDVVWCNLIALCFSGIFNFAMGEFVVFGSKKLKK